MVFDFLFVAVIILWKMVCIGCGVNLERDILVADIEELGEIGRVRHLRSKAQYSRSFNVERWRKIPFAHGTAKLFGRDHGV